MPTKRPIKLVKAPATRCEKCRKNGHATLLWHWRHGWYCVPCIREMDELVQDYVQVEQTIHEQETLVLQPAVLKRSKGVKP